MKGGWGGGRGVGEERLRGGGGGERDRGGGRGGRGGEGSVRRVLWGGGVAVRDRG